MSSPRPRHLAGFLIVSLACATHRPPRGWLPTPRESQHAARGGWIGLEYGNAKSRTRLEGELIAVGADQLHVLTSSGLEHVPQASILEARLTAYATSGGIAPWSTLGALSTLSHGAFLLLTLPMWIVTGAVLSNSESRPGRLSHPPTPLALFAPYARFPQGLPPDLNMSALGPLTPPSPPPRR